MQITILNLKHKEDLTEQKIIKYAINKYQILANHVINAKLIKKSLDLREKDNPIYVYKLVFELNEKARNNKMLRNNNIQLDTNYNDSIEVPILNSLDRPIVVGFGPAGMFCAYVFALAGLKPIIFERGSMVSKRVNDVDLFFNNDVFNNESNVCYGEGGAGTFSDGKLNTGINDPLIRFVLKTFVEFGADENVYYDAKPHVGTDKIREVVENLRNKIIELGGEFHFDSFVNDVKENVVTVVEADKEVTYNSKYIILGIGHSARETYQMLYDNGFNLEAKPFSMGVRIEHLQKLINDIQYGPNSDISYAATYNAAVHLENRDVYSFCMCPGGYVVASNSSRGEIVTNGMSYRVRDGLNSNSAILVNVRVDDYYVNSPLDGLWYQKKFEQACYNLTNSYKAPCNLLKEFLCDEVATEFRSVKPTYPNKVVFTSFKGLLPDFIIEALKDGIVEIDKKMPGFLCDDAVLTAIESRSSSPVRILRNKEYESNINGVYPIGEGAGYAGGITSSAVDGIKCALKIISKIKEEK